MGRRAANIGATNRAPTEPSMKIGGREVASTLPMCGIAGYAERGADAVGFAHRGPRPHEVTVHKQRTGPSLLLDRVEVPQTATQVLIHVRDYTKGHPTIAAN